MEEEVREEATATGLVKVEAPPPDAPVVPLTVYATDPEGLKVAHGALLAWATKCELTLRGELVEQQEILTQATRGHWGVRRIKSLIARTEARRLFYGKIIVALEAGYLVVPNMPMTVVAVRTRLNTPAGAANKSDYKWGGPRFLQAGQSLPQGDGEFRNPAPLVNQDVDIEKAKDGTDKTTYTSYPTEWDELVFPLELAKPEIIEKANLALKQKLFDELGFVADASQGRKGDPILVGRIRNPARHKLDMTFFLGWALSVERI